MFNVLRSKFWITAGCVTFGFLMSLWGLKDFYATGLNPQFESSFYKIFFGTLVSFFGCVGGAVWFYYPVVPWMKRYRHLSNWRGWIVQELPTIVGVASSIAVLVPVLKAAWLELKKAYRKGTLDIHTFARVAKQVAEESEELLSAEPIARIHTLKNQFSEHRRTKHRRSNGSRRKAA